MPNREITSDVYIGCDFLTCMGRGGRQVYYWRDGGRAASGILSSNHNYPFPSHIFTSSLCPHLLPSPPSLLPPLSPSLNPHFFSSQATSLYSTPLLSFHFHYTYINNFFCIRSFFFSLSYLLVPPSLFPLPPHVLKKDFHSQFLLLSSMNPLLPLLSPFRYSFILSHCQPQ